MNVGAGLLLVNAPCAKCGCLCGRGELVFYVAELAGDVCLVCLRTLVHHEADDVDGVGAIVEGPYRPNEAAELRQTAWALLVRHNAIVGHGLQTFPEVERAAAQMIADTMPPPAACAEAAE